MSLTSVSAGSPAALVGIDVSKKTLACALLDAATRDIVWEPRLPNTREGLRVLWDKVPASIVRSRSRNWIAILRYRKDLMSRHTSDRVAIDLIALAILRQEGRIVLVQQKLAEDLPPGWVIPGGLVEAGELITEGLAREVREEAGVHIKDISHLAYMMQIDRPLHRAQTIAYCFEVAEWSGELRCQDPDAEVLDVQMVPLAEAVSRLQSNGGWSCIQTPLIAYLLEEQAKGALWLYREDAYGQNRILSL